MAHTPPKRPEEGEFPVATAPRPFHPRLDTPGKTIGSIRDGAQTICSVRFVQVIPGHFDSQFRFPIPSLNQRRFRFRVQRHGARSRLMEAFNFRPRSISYGSRVQLCYTAASDDARRHLMKAFDATLCVNGTRYSNGKEKDASQGQLPWISTSIADALRQVFPTVFSSLKKTQQNSQQNGHAIGGARLRPQCNKHRNANSSPKRRRGPPLLHRHFNQITSFIHPFQRQAQRPHPHFQKTRQFDHSLSLMPGERTPFCISTARRISDIYIMHYICGTMDEKLREKFLKTAMPRSCFAPSFCTISINPSPQNVLKKESYVKKILLETSGNLKFVCVNGDAVTMDGIVKISISTNPEEGEGRRMDSKSNHQMMNSSSSNHLIHQNQWGSCQGHDEGSSKWFQWNCARVLEAKHDKGSSKRTFQWNWDEGLRKNRRFIKIPSEIRFPHQQTTPSFLLLLLYTESID